MRKWGWVVSGLYALIVLALLVPLTFLLQSSSMKVGDLGKAYQEWFTWSCSALAIFSQVLLLWVSVDTTRRRLKPRTPVVVSAIASGLLMMTLSVCIIGAIFVAIWGDSPPDPTIYAIIVVLPVSWVIWGILFYRLGRDSADPVTRAVKWLFRGSVLELLVAVPCHVIVRRRHDCCAPGVTAFGIATGIAIMLISFGPSVLLLFKKRMEQYTVKEVVS